MQRSPARTDTTCRNRRKSDRNNLGDTGHHLPQQSLTFERGKPWSLQDAKEARTKALCVTSTVTSHILTRLQNLLLPAPLENESFLSNALAGSSLAYLEQCTSLSLPMARSARQPELTHP